MSQEAGTIQSMLPPVLVAGVGSETISSLESKFPGEEVAVCATWDGAWEALHSGTFRAAVLGLSGAAGQVGLLKRMRASFPSLGIVVIGVGAELSDAVACMKLGILDFLQAPVDHDRLLSILESIPVPERQSASARGPDPNDLYATSPVLLRNLKSDKDSAWFEFYGTYQHMITGWARAMGCPPGYEDDVMQEVTLKVRDKLSGFDYDRSKGSFRGYLKTAVRHKVIDIRRKEMKTAKIEDHGVARTGDESVHETETIPDEMVSTPLVDDAVFLRSLLYRAMKNARGSVNARTAEIFDRCRLRGHSPEAVAAELKVKTQTVYEAIRRFRDEQLTPAFMELLISHGEKPDPGMIRRVLNKCIDDCVTHETQYVMTMTSAASQSMMKRIRFVLACLETNSPPSDRGAHLLAIPPGRDAAEGHWHRLRAGSSEIGRLKGLAITLDYERVSGRHACVDVAGGRWRVTDLDSKNGTMLNDAALLGSSALASGDVISIAGASLVFYVVED